MKITPAHLRGAAEWVERVNRNQLLDSDPEPVFGQLFSTRRNWAGVRKLDGACAIGMVALLAYGPSYVSEEARTGSFLERADAEDRGLVIYLMTAYGYFDGQQYPACARNLRRAADYLESKQTTVVETPAEPDWLARELVAVLRAEQHEHAGVA